MDKKWNLQDIKPAGRHARSTEAVPQTRPPKKEASYEAAAYESDIEINTSEETETATLQATVNKASRRQSRPKQPLSSGRRRKLLTLSILVVAFLGTMVFIAGQVGGKTELLVQPRTDQPNVNSEFIAYTSPNSDQLGYEILTIEAEGERQVTSSGKTEEVSLPAEGAVTIYKTSAGEQRLIATTRLEDQAGNIYRITEGVSVPGGTTEAPGSVTVSVRSDKAGVQQNAAAGTRFTVPGLASDTTLFNSVYATNQTAFMGGFEGTRVIVDDAELQTAQTAIRTELEAKLRERLPSERPADFISFNNSEKFIYESLPASESMSGGAVVKEKVLLEVPIFAKSAFAKFIAKSLVTGYENNPVRIEDYNAFTFAYNASTSERAKLSDTDNITFVLTGKPLLVWEFDETTLKTDLLGASQSALTGILAAHPAIERAEATFAPFWKKSFPDSAAKITLTEVLDWPQ